MPKNKGKYHGKEEPADASPAEPLMTATERVLNALKPHAKVLIAVSSIIAAVLIGLGIYSWYDKRREAGATAKLHKALKIADALVLEEGDSPPVTPPGREPEPTYASNQARSEAALAALQALEKEYGGADVTKQARLIQAGVLYDLGRYDDCASAYKRAASDAATELLRLVAREGAGYCLEAKALAAKDAGERNAGLDAAMAEYKQLQPDEKGLYRDYALYHQGRVLALKGDKAGATALFKQIVDGMPGSDVASEARARLELLE